MAKGANNNKGDDSNKREGLVVIYNIIANRSVPIVFILVCSLIIANISCDQFGSANVQKFHPNGRYGRRSVDNFADAPGAHTELAKLRFSGRGDESNPLSSLLRLDNSQLQSTSSWTNAEMADKQPIRRLSWLLDNNKKLLNNPRHNPRQQQQQQQQQTSNRTSKRDDDMDSTIDSLASYRQELNKLLKCNYSGVSNLFWCNS